MSMPALLIGGLLVAFVLVVLTVEFVDRRTPRGRGVLGDQLRAPYRNPDRAARLAKSGRLRRDLPDRRT